MPDKPALGNILDEITNMGEDVTQQEKTVVTMAKGAKSSEIQLTINPRCNSSFSLVIWQKPYQCNPTVDEWAVVEPPWVL